MRWHRFVLLTLVCPAAFGADETPLSLEAAVEQALQRAPQISAGVAGLEAAQALEVSAGRLPDPSLVVGIDNLPVNGPDAYSTTRDFMTMRKIGVMQEFPRGEKRRLQHERAESDTDLAAAELTETRLDVARETAQAWIRVASAAAALSELRTLVAEVDLGAAAARAGVASGRTSSAEALAAEAAVARLKTRMLRMQGEVRSAQAQLAQWIGENANRPFTALPDFGQLSASAETLLSTPHLHAALLPFDARLAGARTDIAIARADRRPDWSAELSFAKRGPDFSDMASLQFTVGLPILAKYRQNPVIAARAAQLRRVEAERESEVRMHTAELQQTVIEWQQSGEQLKQYETDLVPLARERSRVALASYRAGGSDLKLALDAYQDEVALLIERAALQNEHGRVWAYLRYLEAAHLSP